MMKVKVIKQDSEYFRAQLEKYAHLLEPVDYTQIKRRERYIRYLPADRYWAVFTMPHAVNATPILRSRFDNVISAVHSALGYP